MIFVGVDWAESHHDVAVKDGSGITLIKRRVPDDIEGIRIFHEFVGPLIEDPNEVLVGIETDRGLFVGSLVASGYRVFAVNPFSSSRYRDRHSSSGAKSDPGDAEVLADLVRTDSHNHREIAGDSEIVEDSLVQRSPRHFAVLVDNAASKSAPLRSKRPCELTNYKLQR